MDVLSELSVILEQRRMADPATSYVAQLYHNGLNTILKKVGEESAEVVIAAKDAETTGHHEALVYEVADLWFHSLVLLAHFQRGHEDILQELSRRFSMSGLVEKAQRTSSLQRTSSSQPTSSSQEES